MYFQIDADRSNHSIYVMQEHQERCRDENKRRAEIYPGCQRTSENRYAENGKDGAADTTFEMSWSRVRMV